ncbi:S1C family serine protease [Paenibacillus humicola]|uniref:S1C family serine protease n=1 Tax=Paenibacillus humicola TaxID=3110540 RepID=UPI00237AE94F|nr:trypsin-like peptidase domain-containing protein [Paenibacillus humicola]
MSLFDDDFYSTRVSRRARQESRGEKSFSFGKSPSAGSWSNVRIAMTSSIISSLAAVLLFGLIVGFHRDGGSVAAGSSVAAVKTSDPLDRTIQAAAKVRPAVVSIINEQPLPKGAAGGTDDGGPQIDDGTGLEEAALGSGFIFEKVKGKAHIITNNHVVEDAEAVKVVLSDGETRDAKVLGKDEISDLAVLEIDGKGIDTTAEIGDSDALQAGQVVMAIGNPLGLSDSLTMGIVSKTKRIIPVSLNQDGNYDWEQEVIQVDASINQGNSGGPLINLDGKVVGINSMKVADFGVEGVGFAIPTHSAMPVVKSLLEYGKVKRPYLGVYTMDLEQYFAQAQPGGGHAGPGGFDGSEGSDGDGSTSGSDDGIGGDGLNGGPSAGTADNGGELKLPQKGDLKLPASVKQGVIVLQAVGPAAEAGLQFNDVIVKLDKQPIGSTLELRKYLYARKSIGDDINVTFYRDGKLQSVTFKLTENQED